MAIGPTEIPWTSSAVPSAIASRYTGNAQITSSEREIRESVNPPKNPAMMPKRIAKKHVITAAPIPIRSDDRPP